MELFIRKRVVQNCLLGIELLVTMTYRGILIASSLEFSSPSNKDTFRTETFIFSNLQLSRSVINHDFRGNPLIYSGSDEE